MANTVPTNETEEFRLNEKDASRAFRDRIVSLARPMRKFSREKVVG
jgi:hypothetical protein